MIPVLLKELEKSQKFFWSFFGYHIEFYPFKSNKHYRYSKFSKARDLSGPPRMSLESLLTEENLAEKPATYLGIFSGTVVVAFQILLNINSKDLHDLFLQFFSHIWSCNEANFK